MSFLDRLERKFSKYAIRNLMYYIIVCQVVGLIIKTVSPKFLYYYLTLDMYSIIHKLQIWRFVTFVLVPGSGSLQGIDVLFTAITLYFMYYLGKNLESVWGTVRFNLFYVSGILLNILAALIIYLISGDQYEQMISSYYFGSIGLYYINITLIMVCSFIFADMQVLLYFVIPLKMKYLGIFYVAMTVLQMVQAVAAGNLVTGIAIFAALLNFAIFFFATRKRKAFSAKQVRRKIKYKEQVRNAYTNGPRHRCSVCGRTELDDPNLDFRFCSRCEGNYEYCSDHLFTHEHVKRS